MILDPSYMDDCIEILEVQLDREERELQAKKAGLAKMRAKFEQERNTLSNDVIWEVSSFLDAKEYEVNRKLLTIKDEKEALQRRRDTK